MYFDVRVYMVVVCVFIHVYACVLPRVCTRGNQRLTVDVFLYCSPPLFCRQCISLNLMFSILARLAGQQVLSVCLPVSVSSPRTGVEDI